MWWHMMEWLYSNIYLAIIEFYLLNPFKRIEIGWKYEMIINLLYDKSE